MNRTGFHARVTAVLGHYTMVKESPRLSRAACSLQCAHSATVPLAFAILQCQTLLYPRALMVRLHSDLLVALVTVATCGA